MAFFNEFPHTHYYDSDLAWLIKRMKLVLSRMDSVEERMKAVEELLIDFVESLDIDQVIKDELQRMIDEGDIDGILQRLLDPVIEEVRKNDFQVFRATNLPLTIPRLSLILRDLFVIVRLPFVAIVSQSRGFIDESVGANGMRNTVKLSLFEEQPKMGDLTLENFFNSFIRNQQSELTRYYNEVVDPANRSAYIQNAIGLRRILGIGATTTNSGFQVGRLASTGGNNPYEMSNSTPGVSNQVVVDNNFDYPIFQITIL